MKLPLLFSTCLLMFGCASAPKPVAQHPNHDACLVIYWHMIGMEIRKDMEPGKHYDDKELTESISSLHKELFRTGVTQKTIGACLRLNTQQINCMRDAYTFEAISSCEQLYANKEHQ